MSVLHCLRMIIAICVLCFFSGIYCNKYVMKLTATEIASVKDNTGVNLIYFYKKAANREGLHQQKRFLEEYEKSAKLLDVYDLKFGKVDCPTPGLETFCDRPEIETKVMVFRNGMELLGLDLNNMFDIDSIVSNVLQLVLLRDVPIVQSLKELTDLVITHRGQRDVILSYQHAIGTHAHRVYMEVAFAYKSKYKFALTTTKEVVENLVDFKKDEEASLWVLKSSLAKTGEDGNYPTYKYRENMDLMQLARYARNLDKELVHEVSSDHEDNPFVELDLHTVLMFCNQETRKVVKNQAQEMLDDFYGLVGVLVVNVDKVDGSKFGFDAERMAVPSISFQYRRQTVFNIMPANKHPHVFVNNYLSRVSRLERRSVGGGGEFGEVLVEEEEEEMEGLEEEGYGQKPTEAEVAHQNEQELIETQDDHVAAAVYRLRKEKIDRSELPVLNDTSFYREAKEREIMVVLFYLTFDARSMAFLRHYSAASLQLSSLGLRPLAAIDCFDWTDVCAKENVTSYPTVRIYRKGQEMRVYKGMLSQEAVVRTVLLYLAKSPIPLTSEEKYDSFKSGELPKAIGQHTSVSVLGIFDSQSQELRIFKEAAAQLEGQYLFGYVSGNLLHEMGSSKCQARPTGVVVYRRHDPLNHRTVYTDKLTEVSTLVELVQKEALASFPELSVTNLPAYMAKKLPFVILFASTLETESRELLSKMAASPDSQSDVVFCWMNVTKPTGLAKQIMLEYNPAATAPALSLVNHAQGSVYNYNGIEMARAKITDWINDCVQRKIQPSKMLLTKEWKPRHPGYDFLKLIEEDKQKKLETDTMSVDESLALPDEVARSHLQQLHQPDERSRFRHKPTDTKHAAGQMETKPVTPQHEHVEL